MGLEEEQAQPVDIKSMSVTKLIAWLVKEAKIPKEHIVETDWLKLKLNGQKI